MLWWKPSDADELATLFERIAAGELRPVIDRRFPLSGIVSVQRYVDVGRARGKIVNEM